MDEVVHTELERLRDEDRRQNRRIEVLEAQSKSIQDLALSVHTLAHDMAGMLDEQREQGKRLSALEAEPVNTWKSIKTTIITGIVSALAGGLATGLIFVLSNSIH